MVVSLLPLAVTADGTDTNVKNGYYENGVWKEGTLTQELPTGVDSVSKTAVKRADNQYEVTLKVVLSETTESSHAAAATVLVIDTSGSMDNCSECGNEISVDWGGFTGHKRTCKYYNNTDFYETRLESAMKAAIDFLKSYSGFEAASFNADGSIKNGVADKKLGRYVSVVEFYDKAVVKTSGGGSDGWADVSTVQGYRKVFDVIKKLEAGGATNLEQGLVKANGQFDKNLVKNIPLKNVIVLTDGAPTFYGTAPVEKHGNYGCPDTNRETKTAADNLKKASKVYTVCFGVAEELCWKKGSLHKDGGLFGTSEYHSADGPKVGDFLKDSIATPAADGNNYAYNAGGTDELIDAFKHITEAITSGIKAGTVTDSLPTGITVEEGSEYSDTWVLDPEEAVKEGPDSNGKITYTYTKTYTVTIDPETVIADDDGYAPLNGETKLEVTVDNETKTIAFPIPAGKVAYPTFSVVYQITGTIPDGITAPTDSNTYKKGDNVTVKPGFDVPGYTFDGWYNGTTKVSGELTMPGNNVTLTGSFTANTDTAYTVEHYWQNITDNDYTLHETEKDLTGTTGASTNAQAKAYTGFTAQPFDQKTIEGNGTTVVEIYYNRNTYKVTYDYGDAPEGASALPVDNTEYRYGAEVEVAAKAECEGFEFHGWTVPSDVEVTDNKFIMPAKDVTLSGEFTLEEQWTEPEITLLIPFEKKITVSPGSQTPAPASFKFKIEVAEGIRGFKFTFVPEEGDEIPVDDDGTFTIPNVDGDINGSIRVVGTVGQFAAIRRAPNQDKTNWSLRMTEIDGGSDGWTYDSSEQLFFFAGTTFLRAESSGIEIRKNFDPIDLTRVSKLRVRYFVGDTGLADQNQLELTSSGQPDKYEDHWIPLNGAQNGWNLIEPTLPGTHDPEDPGANLAAVNFFRMYALYNGAPRGNNTIYIDSVSYMKDGVMHYIISPEEARNAAHNSYNGEQKFVFKNTYNKPEEITVTVPLVKKTLTTDMSIKDEKFEYEVFFVFENLETDEKPFSAKLYDQNNEITTYPTVTELTKEEIISSLDYSETYIKENNVTAYSVKAKVGIGFGEGTYFNYLNIIGQESVLEKVKLVRFKENLTAKQIANGWNNTQSSGIYVKLSNEDGEGATYTAYTVVGVVKSDEENNLNNNYFAVDSARLGSPFVIFAAKNEIKHEEPEITVTVPFSKAVGKTENSLNPAEEKFDFEILVMLMRGYNENEIPFNASIGQRQLEVVKISESEAFEKFGGIVLPDRTFYIIKLSIETKGENLYADNILITAKKSVIEMFEALACNEILTADQMKNWTSSAVENFHPFGLNWEFVIEDDVTYFPSMFDSSPYARFRFINTYNKISEMHSIEIPFEKQISVAESSKMPLKTDFTFKVGLKSEEGLTVKFVADDGTEYPCNTKGQFTVPVDVDGIKGKIVITGSFEALSRLEITGTPNESNNSVNITEVNSRAPYWTYDNHMNWFIVVKNITSGINPNIGYTSATPEDMTGKDYIYAKIWINGIENHHNINEGYQSSMPSNFNTANPYWDILTGPNGKYLNTRDGYDNIKLENGWNYIKLNVNSGYCVNAQAIDIKNIRSWWFGIETLPDTTAEIIVEYIGFGTEDEMPGENDYIYRNRVFKVMGGAVPFVNTYNKFVEDPIEKNKVTLPHWVTLMYMDGNDQLKRKAYIYEDLAKLNYTPTREGYTFTGWYTDSSCTVKITQIRMKGDIKVYAGWEKNEK